MKADQLQTKWPKDVMKIPSRVARFTAACCFLQVTANSNNNNVIITFQ